MNTSEQINELAEALSKAQGEMTGAAKSADNPFFKTKYSDLSSVIAAITAPFSSNGLAFIQSPSFSDGVVLISTRIIHKSGQWIEGVIGIPLTNKRDAQAVGSAITYGKRYALQSMSGVPSVDDDGQFAVATMAVEPAPKKPTLTPEDGRMWEGAIAAYKRDGNLDSVLERCVLSKAHQDLIISGGKSG